MDRASRSSRIDALLALAFVATIASLATNSDRPPEVVPARAPADQFSAERAMGHVQVIARAAHPTGSPEAAKVRDYLIDAMTELGLQPEVRTTPSMPGQSVLGRLPGRNPNGKALLLMAHYDSAPEGPGAGDDAAGVAAILESVRALKNSPQLANDVFVLITDAEERGLCGARAFAEDAQARDRVGLVLNFEARGSRGASLMFETSDRNGWMVRQLARSAPRPTANSLSGSIYRLMPNSTDLTVLMGVGLKGLNFAFVEGVENYHQPSDTPANLDPKSVQHHGSYALALARAFGNLDLSLAASEPDTVYFNVKGLTLVVYPSSWVGPLMMLAVVGFGAVLAIGRRRGRITDRGLMIGIGLGLLAVLLAVFGAWSAWSQIARFRPPVGRKHYQGSPGIAAMLVALGIMATLCVYLPALKKLRADDLILGGLFWWLVGTVATSLALPGGSYLFVWPLLFGLLALGVSIAGRDGSIAGRAASYLGVVPALVLVPPVIYGVCMALGPSIPYAAVPLAALLMLTLVPMLAKFVTPVMPDSGGGVTTS